MSCMIYMEDKIQSLMYQIVHYIQSEERNRTIWKELEDIKEQAEKYIHIAMEYQDNTFTNLPDYYIRYFEMRALQCQFCICCIIRFEIFVKCQKRRMNWRIILNI